MRHIVITGGSSGLGAALSRRYLARGDRVTLVARDGAKLEQARDRARLETGQSPAVLACDVGDAEGLGRALVAVDQSQPVDVLIANAGLGGRDVLAGPGGESGDLARRIYEVNAVGVINTVTPLLGPMVERGRGHIVVVGSVGGLIALPQSPAYSASKAAVYSYGHGLRRLLKPQGVRVTVVSPGFVDTPMSRSLPFARPLLVDADRAAGIIVRAVDRGKAEVIFPWPFRLAVGLHALLPTAVADRIVAAAARAIPPSS